MARIWWEWQAKAHQFCTKMFWTFLTPSPRAGSPRQIYHLVILHYIIFIYFTSTHLMIWKDPQDSLHKKVKMQLYWSNFHLFWHLALLWNPQRIQVSNYHSAVMTVPISFHLISPAWLPADGWLIRTLGDLFIWMFTIAWASSTAAINTEGAFISRAECNSYWSNIFPKDACLFAFSNIMIYNMSVLPRSFYIYVEMLLWWDCALPWTYMGILSMQFGLSVSVPLGRS